MTKLAETMEEELDCAHKYEGQHLLGMKGILLILIIIAAHGCTLASDQEMEVRLTNHWKAVQQECHR